MLPRPPRRAIPLTTAPAAPAPSRRPRYVSRNDAARMVGRSRRTLERRIAAGEQPVRRFARRVLVRPADLAELVEGRAGPADPPD